MVTVAEKAERPRVANWVRPALTQGIAPKVVAFGCAIGVWQLLLTAGIVSPLALASPSEVVRTSAHLVGQGSFWQVLGETVKSWVIGLLLSAAVAIPLGLLLGSSEIAYRSCRFTIDFLRTIPPVAVIPLLLLLYGARTQTAVMLVLLGAVWPLVLQSMYGVQQVDPLVREVARSYRLRRRDVVVSVILPSAAPFIATGLRIAASMSLLLTIGAELIGGVPGLGNSIASAQTNGDIPAMYAYIFACAMLGVLINRTMLRGAGRLLAWHSAQRTAPKR
jgi:ABC-type nitrate/sulfonate/bicarbonate transport system permease component